MTTRTTSARRSMNDTIARSPSEPVEPTPVVGDYAADVPTAGVPVTKTPGPRLSIVVSPSALIYASAVAVVIGFALLAYTWDRVSTLTIVAAQIPWLVSSGLTGLGLIVVGAALVIVWSRRSDDTERRRQTDELIDALREIRAGLEADRDR